MVTGKLVLGYPIGTASNEILFLPNREHRLTSDTQAINPDIACELSRIHLYYSHCFMSNTLNRGAESTNMYPDNMVDSADFSTPAAFPR
jgi:hypothetical protein